MPTRVPLHLIIYSGGVGLQGKYPSRLYCRYSIWITISIRVLIDHIIYHLVVPRSISPTIAFYLGSALLHKEDAIAYP